MERATELARQHGRILFAPAVDEALAEAWLAEYSSWFGEGRPDPVPGAEGHPRLALLETPLGSVVAKREVPTGWKASLVRTGARSLRSQRAFELARALRAESIGTPEPLACITIHEREACLVTRYVEALTPWTYLLACSGAAPIRRLEETLARSISLLHAKGFRHRDLKAPNILARSAGDRIEILLVDLDGASRSPVTESVRVRDMARLCMSFESAAARLAGIHADSWPRVVSHYLEAALGRAPERHEVERFVQRTRRWSTRSIERNLTRGRPIA